jgi:beta-1,4-mannosyltransferase
MGAAVFDSPWEYLLAAAVLFSTFTTILLLTFPSRYDPQRDKRVLDVGPLEGDAALDGAGQKQKTGRPPVSVQIVVLGDIGRSPRMQYHALSIAKHGGRVDLIGYQGKPSHTCHF